jgi:hypothetical protein
MIKRYQRTAISQYIIVGLILIALFTMGYLSMLVMKTIPFTDHFALPWAATRAWLLEGRNPYDPTIAEEAANAIEGAGYLGQLPEEDALIQPLINLFFYFPFSFIPYSFSRAIWVVALMVCSGLIVHLSLKFSEWEITALEKILITACFVLWFPGIYEIFSGDLKLIMILLMVYGLFLIKAGKFRTAGFVLALSAGSLPLTIFIIILASLWSVARKEWTYLIAFFSGSAFLWIVSLLMLPSWPMDWLRTLFGTYQDFSWIRTPIMIVASFLPGIEQFLSIFLHATFGIILLVLWIKLFERTERIFIWNALAVLVMGSLFQVRVEFSGISMLIPPLCFVFKYASDRWKSLGKFSVWFLAILIFTGPWILVLPDVQFSETVSLPIITIGLPYLVFFSMIWIRWWAVKLTSLPRI